MILRLSLDGAVKCALRDLRREEDTFGLNFIVSVCSCALFLFYKFATNRSLVLYKHSFRARKVVQTMDLREREKRKESCIRVGHPKQLDRKNRTSEKLHQKQLPLSLLLLS